MPLESIQIPKFGGPLVVSPEAVHAPDAPMVPASGTPPIPPAAIPGQAPPQGDFLAGVRDVNQRRADAVEAKKAPKLDAPPDQPPKQDTVPDVFKKIAASDDTDQGDDGEGDDDTGDGFQDPLENEPAKEKPEKIKNIKVLRRKLQTVTARETQLRTRNDELKAEVERLASFEEKLDEYEQMRTRIQELETYEKIFDIHKNPEFQQKHVVGRANLVKEGSEIAAQYGIEDPAFIEAAARITNRKEQNDFLKRHLKDELAVQDVRPYILQIQGLDHEKIQLEKSPEQAREILSKMYRENEEHRVTALNKTIHERSTSAWNSIVGYYSTGDTAVDAFKEKPSDPEHSDRRTNVLNRANGEYVKMMGAFSGLGIRDLPQPIAHTLAARFQLSEWAGEFIAENKTLKTQIAELTKQIKEMGNYTRPGFSPSGQRTAPTNGEIPKGTDIASHVFGKAQSRLAAQVK